MNGDAIRALLWKDYRINRLVLIVGAVLWLGPYGVSVVYYDPAAAPTPWALLLSIATYASLVLTLLTAALLGGSIVATERMDRSAEFLAYLPPSRRTVVLAKALFAVSPLLLIWTVDLFLLHLATRSDALPAKEYASGLSALAGATVVVFGVSWLAASVSDSPAIAAGAGLGAALLLFLALACAINAHNHHAADDGDVLDIRTWYTALGLILGALSFAGGVVHCVRRRSGG